eukprot:GAFH01000352.1.p1 GENE.GAFH01000352.1~~GAFH01000352.1.p1  ORF type:complete len:332 (+),score=36.42 GAFH01000352.1:368-1363(+)
MVAVMMTRGRGHSWGPGFRSRPAHSASVPRPVVLPAPSRPARTTVNRHTATAIGYSSSSNNSNHSINSSSNNARSIPIIAFRLAVIIVLVTVPPAAAPVEATAATTTFLIASPAVPTPNTTRSPVPRTPICDPAHHRPLATPPPPSRPRPTAIHLRAPTIISIIIITRALPAALPRANGRPSPRPSRPHHAPPCLGPLAVLLLPSAGPPARLASPTAVVTTPAPPPAIHQHQHRHLTTRHQRTSDRQQWRLCPNHHHHCPAVQHPTHHPAAPPAACSPCRCLSCGRAAPPRWWVAHHPLARHHHHHPPDSPRLPRAGSGLASPTTTTSSRN